MSSKNRIAANRANAQKSTGPKTEAGKAASRVNATRHGLSGKFVVIDGEDPAAYDALRQDLIASYKPANAAETMLVDEIAQNYWRLQRVRVIEARTFDMHCVGGEPVIGFRCGQDSFNTIRRYMTSIERAWLRAIEQLQKTQAIRAKQQPDAAAESSHEPDSNSGGFVSQPSIGYSCRSFGNVRDLPNMLENTHLQPADEPLAA